MKRIIFTIVFQLLFLFGFSSILDSNSIKKDSIVYYKDHSEKLLIKLGITTTTPTLDIVNTHNNSTLTLKPVGQTSISAAMEYKWFGIGLGLGLPQSEKDINTKGRTTNLDLQFNIYSKIIGGDAYFQHYKGFHMLNPNSFTQWKSDTMPQLGSMKQYAVGVSAFYITNHKRFSYGASYSRSSTQHKSAGSPLIGFYFNLDAAASDKGFVPFDSLLIAARDSFSIYAYSSTNYGISLGYSYTLLLGKKFFTNITLMPGFGFKNITMKNFTIDSTGVDLSSSFSNRGTSSRVMYRFAFGYEGEKYLFGMTFYGSYGAIQIENFQFKPSLGTFRFFIARRFDVSSKNKPKKQ
ncbi:MAG: DUF4421 family protein [Flavobacteriales bacterium]|nr:DUF4421 family protein [Flavobacteriales bacterium]